MVVRPRTDNEMCRRASHKYKRILDTVWRKEVIDVIKAGMPLHLGPAQ